MRDDAVQLDVYHGMSHVDVAHGDELIAPLIAKAVEYGETQFELGGKLGYRERRVTVPICKVDKTDRMAVPTGLIPRVTSHLEQHGYTVDVNDHRKFGKRFTIDEDRLSRATGDDRRLLRAVQEHPLGQIEVRDTRDMIACMAMISQFFSMTRVLIPVAQRKFAWYIRQQLNELVLDFDVKVKRGTWPETQPKCMVTTWQPMNSLDARKVDVVLLPDPLRATQQKFSGVMAQFIGKPHRCYSFVRPGQHLGRRGSIRLEAMSGPVIYRVDPGRPPARVFWLETPSCPGTNHEQRCLEWKRKAYWQNNRRNEYVASVARAFAEMNTAKLRKYGVPFRGDRPAIPKAGRPEVVVLVESVEHGRELHRRLKDWELVDRVPGATVPDPYSDTKGSIVTTVKAAKDGFDGDVVIRATGSTGKGMFSRFPVTLNTAPVLVVDFTDDCDSLAREDAKRRRREYELQGWDETARVDVQSKYPIVTEVGQKT